MALETHQELAEDILAKAQKKGAEHADIIIIESADTSVTVRNSQQESIERAESKVIGLRVLIGKKQAVISSSNMLPSQIEEMTAQVVEMAKCAPEDPYASIAEATEYADSLPDITPVDSKEPTTKWLQEQAEQAEQAALSTEGITNSEGADAAHGRNTITLATTNGFNRSYHNARTSLSLSVIAGQGTKMERDYDYSTVCLREDLEGAVVLGKNAAEKAIKRLNPQKVTTGKYPIIVDPEIARRIIGSFAAAINGVSIARGSSFLIDQMGKKLFPESITITDDPHQHKGLGSRPFDAEGITGKAMNLVDQGTLTSWLLDLRSAEQLKLCTTGHATRRTNSTPSPAPTNVYVSPGKQTPEELIAELGNGIYITDTFGMGINHVTGDYSQGAAGFMIENGKITVPVSGFTIAGTLQQIFSEFNVANDLCVKSKINCPTAYIGEMMVAGSD